MSRTRRQVRSVLRLTHSVTALILVAVTFGLAGMVVAGQDSHQGTPSSMASECVQASPHAANATPTVTGSPVSSPAATPDVVGLGTPATQSCLTVTLTADGLAAGPRTLTVEVVDASGAPVVDAEVVINTRSLVMDHGVSTNQATPTDPGRYVIEQVPMGMAGAWEAEVVVTRPGQSPVMVLIIVDLEGPA